MAQPAFGGRLVGYARVSTDDQDLSLQMDSLIGLGISDDDIFTDKASGAKTERPGLGACLAKLQPGDTLVVWRLDRLGRSMHHLVELIEVLRSRGVGFRSVSDGLIDTTSPSGELIFHIFSALAQFEMQPQLMTYHNAFVRMPPSEVGRGSAYRFVQLQAMATTAVAAPGK